MEQKNQNEKNNKQKNQTTNKNKHIVDDIIAHTVDVFVSKIDFNISHISDHNHFIVALILSLVVHPFVFWHDFYDTYNVPQYFVNIVAHDIVA